MAQFDVHANPIGDMADAAPYVVDLQSEQIAGLPTRMIAPLVRAEGFRPLGHLNPMVEVDGEKFAVMVNLMAAVPQQVLEPRIASLAERRYDILGALDFLFTGI